MIHTTTHTKRIGMWLDHQQAHLIDINKGEAVAQTVFSNQESQLHIDGESGDGMRLSNNRSTNNEHHHHSKDREIIDEYYKILADRLSHYDDIYLFGPTTAKEELANMIQADKHFLGKTIHVNAADQMTENQMIAEVKHFFKA